eukprot:474382-Pleurochrysis_carterae.AAC.1
MSEEGKLASQQGTGEKAIARAYDETGRQGSYAGLRQLRESLWCACVCPCVALCLDACARHSARMIVGENERESGRE